MELFSWMYAVSVPFKEKLTANYSGETSTKFWKKN